MKDLPKKYKYICWFDNKYDIRTDTVERNIINMNKIAIMCPLHNFLKGPTGEINSSSEQTCYKNLTPLWKKYIEEEKAAGYPEKQEKYFTTSLII